MEEVVLTVENFTEIFSEALEKVPPLRDYGGRCPECGRTPIKYNSRRRRHLCLWRDCPWVEETDSLPLRSISGRRLTPGEIVTMVLKNIERGR